MRDTYSNFLNTKWEEIVQYLSSTEYTLEDLEDLIENLNSKYKTIDV